MPQWAGAARCGVGCVLAPWAVFHTLFTLTYACLYYTDPVGGVDFTQEPDSTYRDFAYLGSTVGHDLPGLGHRHRRCVKDTIRSTVLRHVLLSWVWCSRPI